MVPGKLITIICISLGLFMGSTGILYATVIRGVILHGVVIDGSPEPCAGKAIGGMCTDGAQYAGTWNGTGTTYRYETTPGNCTDYVNDHTSFTPTCNGVTDTITHAWANDSGTTAYGVTTGTSSTTDGKANTTILLAYTDTDAARYCRYMNYAGHTDWYLPAASLANDTNGELYNVLYVNKAAIGGFQSSWYWSSTEASTTNAMFVNFASGIQPNIAKTTNFYIRCLRRY